MPAPLLALTDIHLTFGGTPLLEGADLSLMAGERVALVGRNGSGKSTLLKIAAGTVEADSGERFLQPGVTLRYLPQEPDLSGFANTLDYVEDGLAPGDEAYRAQYLLEQLGLNGRENPAALSGGEARRAALARALAPEPDILLFDEPTNHLDLPAIEWLETELKSLKSALVLISHDRRILSELSRATVWLDRGESRRLDQGFTAFEAWRDKLFEEEDAERHKLDRKIVREEHWVTYGVTARRKRNVRRMNELADLRRERANQRSRAGAVQMSIAEGKTSGKIVINAEGLRKSYGERTIVDDLDIRVMRGDRLGIIGPNGAGKTTLINMLTGVLAPDSGTINLGTNIELASLDQRRASLGADTSLQDALTGGGTDQVVINGQGRHVISYMKEFLFAPEQAGTALSRLSGGERARVMLARALSLPSNLLVLDEPTNDLDLETLDLLQEMIADYPGTVIVVSHDRDFLDRVATSILAFEGEGRWTEYAGGYSDMVRQRGSGASTPLSSSPTPKPKSVAADKPAPERRKKLSFNQQHALKTLPGQIEKLQAEIATLQTRLADPDFYVRDAAGFAKTSAALSAAETALEAAETNWLELELLREELES